MTVIVLSAHPASDPLAFRALRLDQEENAVRERGVLDLVQWELWVEYSVESHLSRMLLVRRRMERRARRYGKVEGGGEVKFRNQRNPLRTR